MTRSLTEIVVVPHSHTDYGFTHDQPIVDELHRGFLTDALDLCEQDEGFHWTVETCGMMPGWLQRATSRDIDRLRALEAAGRIEIAAMPYHVTPLTDGRDMADLLELPARLRRDYGFTITSAMNSDVNGQNWPVVEAMLNAGVDGFSMAINSHFGKAPLHRPDVFWWEGYSGRRIRAYNGFAYGFDGKLGLLEADIRIFRDKWLPKLQRRLQEGSYPLGVMLVQGIAPFGDNGPPDSAVVDFARRWNTEGLLPRITIGTPRTFWRKVSEEEAEMPVYRGDWTDSWNFGSLSRAREVAIQRNNRARIRATESLLTRLGSPADLEIRPVLDDARADYNRYHEHTWSADCTVGEPFSEDAWVQSAHKSALCARARSLSLFAQREALGALAQTEAQSNDHLLIANPLPFDRLITGLVGGSSSHPRGRATDRRSARHSQDRKMDFDLLVTGRPLMNEWAQDPGFVLRPTLVPGNSHVVVASKDVLVSPFDGIEIGEDATVETASHLFQFDKKRGGLISWLDKRLDREILAPHALAPGLGYVFERVASGSGNPRAELFYMDWSSPEIEAPNGWKPGWPAQRETATRVLEHRVIRNPLGIEVRQGIEAPGCASAIQWILWIPAHADWVEVRVSWLCGLDTHPSSQYITIPLAIPDAGATLDQGGVPMVPGRDQIPGTQMDYYTVQNWVDLTAKDGSFGVTIATPENPMIQLGGFRFAENASAFTLPEPTVLGWITSSYWETNFSPVQPGRVSARYRILPHAGPLDIAEADRFGLDALYVQPLIQQMGETRIS